MHTSFACSIWFAHIDTIHINEISCTWVIAWYHKLKLFQHSRISSPDNNLVIIILSLTFWIFSLLTTGLCNAWFELWLHVDPSSSRSSNFSCFLCPGGGVVSASFLQNDTCFYDGKMSIMLLKCGLWECCSLPAFHWVVRGSLMA